MIIFAVKVLGFNAIHFYFHRTKAAKERGLIPNADNRRCHGKENNNIGYDTDKITNRNFYDNNYAFIKDKLRIKCITYIIDK